jgi:hypothetical protein
MASQTRRRTIRVEPFESFVIRMADEHYYQLYAVRALLELAWLLRFDKARWRPHSRAGSFEDA